MSDRKIMKFPHCEIENCKQTADCLIFLLQHTDVVVHYSTGEMDRFFKQTQQLMKENTDMTAP